MNPVGELLRVEDVVLDLEASDQRDVLGRIAALLARGRGMTEADVRAALIAREQIGSTGLGHGVAIPHARMPQCGAAAAAFVRTKHAVPFAAPDGRPVSVFLGLLVPQRATERHLQLLAAAAAMFSDRSFRVALKSSAGPAEVRQLVVAWPDAVPSPMSDQTAGS
jgi:nitrogen PTS system EIIA component